MPHKFTRQALYDLVWSEPMRTLATKYGISDRGLAKTCAASKIPVPERGYWAKLQAGQKVSKMPLPPRALGQSDEITIGGSSYRSSYWYYPETEADILNNPIPPLPVFEEDIEAIRARVVVMVNKAPLLKKWCSRTHHLIENILKKDKERAEKARATWGSSSSWAAPVFGTKFEMRRLNILNGLFLCLGFCGMHPSISGKEGRNLSVVVGDSRVSFDVEAAGIEKQLERERMGYSFEARDPNAKMRLSISGWESERSWQDSQDDRLEKHLREIAIELIVAGEQQYRHGVIRHREWLIQRKKDLEERERQRKIEDERKRREREAQMEKQRVDHLLRLAESMDKAARIREVVARIQEANRTSPHPMGSEELAS